MLQNWAGYEWLLKPLSKETWWTWALLYFTLRLHINDLNALMSGIRSDVWLYIIIKSTEWCKSHNQVCWRCFLLTAVPKSSALNMKTLFNYCQEMTQCSLLCWRERRQGEEGNINIVFITVGMIQSHTWCKLDMGSDVWLPITTSPII